jgi:acetyl esterase/lipase
MRKILKLGWPVLLLAALLFIMSCQAGTPTVSPLPLTPLSTTTLSQTLPSPTMVSPTTPAPSPLLGPAPSRLGKVEKDVTYGNADNVALKLDIYYPKTAAGALPVVMYVHGGAWTQGEKDDGAGMSEIPELVRRGYLVVSVNYRLAPQHKFPAQIEDVKCAVRFLRAKASSYGLNPDKIGVWGGSAGGHLVALLGTSDVSAGLEGSGGYAYQSSRVQAVVDFFGPADLSVLFRGNRGALMDDVFGTSNADSQVLKLASPVTYISRDDPPFLIIHGDKDIVVPLNQSQILYDRLSAAGIPATLVVVKNAGHSFTPTGGSISPTRIEITTMVADFFDKYLK